MGETPTPSNGLSITRNPGARFFLPSENEWYKAAYHKNDGITGNYWNYPTGSNVEPNSDQPPGSLAIQTHAGNFYRNDGLVNGYNDGYAITGSTSLSGSQNYLTDVGAYTYSPGPYGTFDQSGNVWEWNEALLIFDSQRGLRGGSWYRNSSTLSASWRDYTNPASRRDHVGFRLAMIPEPTTGALAIWAAIGLWWLRRRKR